MDLALLLKTVASRYARETVIESYRIALEKWLKIYEMDTKLRTCAFLSQCAHETDGFVFFKELGNKNYFSKYEADTPIGKKLGNVVYGEGFKYRARGIIPIIGRFNYEKYGRLINRDLILDPDLLLVPDIGTQAACEFWKQHKLNNLSDNSDIIGVTKAINGGINGLKQRQAYYSSLLNVFDK